MGGLPTDGMQTGVPDPAQPDADSKTDIKRGQPEVDESRKGLVNRWQSRVRTGKQHWEKRFKRMRDDQQVAREGADKIWVAADEYTVPIIARHINQQVAKLYAKNPTMVAKPKDKLRFKVWDGSMQQMQQADQAMQMAAQAEMQTGLPAQIDPQSQAIIQDIQEGKAQMEMLRRMCKTVEILWKYYTNEQKPNFKQQIKQLVRRAKVNGVGYLWLSYQRLLEKKPDVAAKIEDITGKIEATERMQADLIDNIADDNSPTVEELRLNLQDLQADLMMIAREGPVFDFPRSTEIIIDPKCRHLRGFVGARWIAREFHMDLDEVEETYKVDLRGAYTPLRPTDNTSQQTNPPPNSSNNDSQDYKNSDEACVWEVYDKKNRQMFTLIDGYKDFATEPKTPDVDLEGFWPCHALTFNDIEDENELYPPSDVYLLRHPQREHNRARQGLREHRIANRPAYAMPAGMMSDTDKDKLANRPAHAVMELNGMQEGQKVEEVLQAIKPAPIDAALYDTKPSTEDMMLSVGAQQADNGAAMGKVTATESTIAESSRNTDTGSNVDDLDEFLSDVSSDVVQMMLLKVSPETALEIAGPGAVWPDLDREQVVKELDMSIRAGSSGKPNQAAELANMERAWPALQMLPGVNPEPIIRRMSDLLDIPIEELYAEGAPSITAINAAFAKAQQAAQQAPSDQPQDQGGQGGANAEQPPGSAPGGQPAYPADTSMGPAGNPGVTVN